MSGTILIVDDESSARETIFAIFDGLDYRLETAVDGLEAIEKAKKIAPDLILLDVMMPRMDGFGVCRHLREDPLLREVPILLLTSLDDRDSRLNGLRAGADDFISKPFDRHELRARAHTITRLNRYRTLLNQREDLKEMAERVVRAQEEERVRISRDIHDDIGQALTAHQIELTLISAKLEDRADLQQAIQRLIAETSSIFSKLRLLAQDLRPPLLDTLRITQALQAFCADFSNRTGLPVDFEADNDVSAMADIIKVTLYRVLQEALSNIVRHANATQAWVSLNSEEAEICLTIQDNGKNTADQARETEGVGLRGMQERVALSGGVFNFHSVPNQGCIVTVRFLH